MENVNSYSSKDLERFDVQKIFCEHETKFRGLLQWLEVFYYDYKNSKKIIQLLGTWLYFIRSLHESYGMEGLKSYSEGDFACPIRFSFYYEFGFNINYKAKGFKSYLLFKVFNNFLNSALLPGAKVSSIYSKFKWRFSQFVILNIPIQIQASRKDRIVKKIMDYFDEYFTEEEVTELAKYLSNSLPSVFFEDKFNVPEEKELNVECAPWTFFEFSGFERVFLFDRYVKVTGLQHGGGYFGYNLQYGTRFEENISDEFIGWGLSPNRNERQHRYTHRDQNSMTSITPSRLIWVERARLSIFNYFMWPCQLQQLYSLKAIEYVFGELSKVNMKYFNMPYPSHLRSRKYDGLRGEELYSNKNYGENILGFGDIVIFDTSDSSLIHHCIEQEIPFILVVSRDVISGLSRQQNDWFDVIRNAELAFFDDETGMMSKKINEVFQSKYYIPEELKEFHNTVFIDI
jgi:hypothetical protein